MSLGISGDKDTLWRWDLSLNYGENRFDYDITDSLNASLVSLTGDSPENADPGDLFHSLTTLDFDISSRTHWGSLAAGLQWRRDHYRIDAGEPVSFLDYDTVNGSSIGGLDASSGIQVFPGYTPENAISEQRHSQAVFVSAEWNISDQWQANGALRFEHFSDVGNHWSFKLSSAYQWTPSLKIRAGINTGFRAPSLQQRFYSDISNQFVQIGDDLQQLRVATINRDQLETLGINTAPLKEETSFNTNLGLSWMPSDRWYWSLDLYTIDINDRIVISNITATGFDPVLDDYLMDIGAEAYHGFYNGIDTRTQGVDLFGQYQRDLGDALLSLSLSANYNDTRVTKRHEMNHKTGSVGLGIFSSHSESIIEDWQPDWRSVARAGLAWEHWQVSLEAESFGDYRVEERNGDEQRYASKTLINLRTEYHWADGWQVALGANNVFGTTPEKNRIGQTGQGVIVDGDLNPVVSSPGVFQYSRRTTPFGFNGAYYYLSVQRVWD